MAGDGWTRFRLGELVEVKHGWAFKSECFDEHLTGQPIVVGVGNFRYTSGFRFDETANKEYRGSYPKEYELAPRDILLVMTCQTAGGEILGIPARVPNDGRAYLHNQRLGKVVIREGGRVDPDYLYWLFLWSEFNRELVTSASGTKILHTAPSRIEAFRFELPPLPEQRAIAHILGMLDDKIELNRQMNETLEAMARALFQSWFVDFEPVRAKAKRCDPGLANEMADLFPDRFEYSDLGEVPAGWRVGRLDDVLVLQRGFDLPAAARTPGRYPVLAASGPNGTHNQFMVRGPGVTTGRSGVLGNVFYTHEDFWPLNTSLWVKEFKHSTPAYAFHLLRWLDFGAFNAGSAVPTRN
jgi:type I restriction enzyme, S subunit